jgi:hypothetical protein
MLIAKAKESGRTKSRMSFWTHSILTCAALPFALALSSRYFVLSTPVTEKPLFANEMLHLPEPQQRSRTNLPGAWLVPVPSRPARPLRRFAFLKT